MSRQFTSPRVVASLALGAIAFILTGCADPTATAPQVPSASPTQSASPTPTPTPTPTLTTVTLRADSIVAADQNGAPLATLDYYTRGSEVAATLAELFGFAPEVEIVEPIASDFAFSGTRYDWEGFTIHWRYGYESDPDSGNGTYPYGPPILVTVSVPSVRGIAIHAMDGISVGDDKGDLWALYPDESWSFTDEDGVVIDTALVECVDLPEATDSLEPGIPRNCVAVRAEPADGPISALQAPAAIDYGM